jgi:glucose dehydrogenase
MRARYSFFLRPGGAVLKSKQVMSGSMDQVTVRHAFRTTLLAGGIILAVAGGAVAQAASGPSAEYLLNAENDRANWVLPARSYSGNRQIEEAEIGPQDVGQMKVAWTFKLPGSDPVETAPIVWDGTVYVTSGQDDVFALEAETGELKWQYRPNAKQQVGFPRNRGVAIYDGVVFVGMIKDISLL